MTSNRSYLFVTWEGGGNVPPVLGVARRLAERGHDVRVLAEPCQADDVTAAGARFVPFTRHFVRRNCTDDIMGDWRAKTPLGALGNVFRNVVFGPAPIVAAETQRAIDAQRPDVVVVDHLMPGALIPAQAAAIPRVVLFHSPEFLPGAGKPAAGSGFLPREDFIGHVRDGLFKTIFLRLVAPYVSTFNAIRRGYGLPLLKSAEDLVNEYHRADRRLMLTSQAFDFPITPPPANLRYVGPILDDPAWIGEWRDPWPQDDERPLVVASLSSTFQNQRATLQNIITALGALDARGLVTVGPAMSGEAFDTPANVVVVPSAPHSQVFPQAATVITHGGHGTVMRALGHELPLLCLPMGRDQNDNAARVVARGAGLQLGPSAAPDKIAAVVQRLLAEQSFKAGAGRLGRIIAEDAADGRVVRELEAVGGGALRETAVQGSPLNIMAQPARG